MHNLRIYDYNIYSIIYEKNKKRYCQIEINMLELIC